MKSLFGLVIICFISFWLWNNVISPPKYIGFYYPDSSNLFIYKQSPELSSLEQCHEWVNEVSNERTDTNFDYECGKDCKLSKSGEMYVCDETLK